MHKLERMGDVGGLIYLERDDEIYKLREMGYSYTSVAKKFNISRERIAQIYNKRKKLDHIN